MTDQRSDLHRLSVPFPAKFVATKQGASYVNHAIVHQRLLGTVGPFDMRVDQVIRGPFAEKTTGQDNNQRTWPGADNAVVGVVLTCVFTIDGKRVEVSEVGTPEGYYMADHDGERLKKAVSDALKRCAMRVGVGLDLWSKGSYFLPSMLAKDVDPTTGEVEAPEPDHDAPDPDDVAEPTFTDLTEAIADAQQANVEGDFDALAEWAEGNPDRLEDAIGRVRRAIAEKAVTDEAETITREGQ